MTAYEAEVVATSDEAWTERFKIRHPDIGVWYASFPYCLADCIVLAQLPEVEDPPETRHIHMEYPKMLRLKLDWRANNPQTSQTTGTEFAQVADEDERE